MKSLLTQEELLASWRQCMKSGVPNTLNRSSLYITDEDLENTFNESELLISVFEHGLKKMKDLLGEGYCFFLVSKKQILVKKRGI